MLPRIRKSLDKDENQGGFTLIELLVVMIIIGILAAIAIPAFLSQKNKAKETSAKADVSTIGKEIAAYYVDGTLPLALTSGTGTWSLSESGTGASTTPIATGKLSSGNTGIGAATNIVSSDAFCVSVKNIDAPGSWKYSAVGGLSKGTCTSTA